MRRYFCAPACRDLIDRVLVKSDLPVRGSLCFQADGCQIDIPRILYGEGYILCLSRVSAGGKISGRRRSRQAVCPGDLDRNRQLESLTCTGSDKCDRILSGRHILRRNNGCLDRRACTGIHGH